MDIFQRTISCHPLQHKEEEIEIFEAETEDAIEEEQADVRIEREETLDKKSLMQELDCMKRRIQKIQLQFKFESDKSPEENCIDFEVLLNCSENNEICELQKNHHKLQRQISELIKCNRASKEQLNDLCLRLCERAKEIAQLQRHVAILMQWKNTLEHEFGKCIERFEYLKHVKAEWHDVAAKLDQQKKSYSEMEQAFVPNFCFQQQKQSFICAINEIKEMLKELFEYQLQRFDCLEKRLDSVTGDH